MTLFDGLTYPFFKAGAQAIGGAPEGLDALALAAFLRQQPYGRRHLHIARDGARMAALAEALRAFAPELPMLEFPAWDCLPYDRVSPHPQVSARRLDTLVRLARGEAAAAVITTVGAVLQRVPPRDALKAAIFEINAQQPLDLEALRAFLAAAGYRRTATVHEPGEFAQRGGIIDLYPPGAEEPVRLDLFGDEVERIRSFDPESQRTTGEKPAATLLPISEALMDAGSIERFRTRYRELFGAIRDDDPLYASVSAGRRYDGLEHWLPLFYPRLETLVDYVGETAVTLDHQINEAMAARAEQVAEFYGARVTALDARRRAKGAEDAQAYRPVPAELLYLDQAGWDALAARLPLGRFSPFSTPTERNLGAIDLGGRRAPDFSEARKRADGTLFDAVRERLAVDARAGRRLVITATTLGARSRIASLLREHGVAEPLEAAQWQDALAAPPQRLALLVLGFEHGFVTDELALYTEQDLFGERLARPVRRRPAEHFIAELAALSPGDLVVHAEHGIGRFERLETITVGRAPHDCVRILYAGDTKLYLPVENLEVLSRYGGQEATATLDRLGRAEWQARKAKIKERIREIAHQLLRIAAERALRTGERLIASPGAYDEFAARFPYPETEDQARAIADVIEDLGSGRPTDRLVCGDVGFGKTEVALRAAFVAAMGGFQVAVVVPTTLLARQHYASFAERFAGLPVRLGQLSRLVPEKEMRQTKAALADGTLDIVVGTHALLAKSISFKRLGLLVVDEEQHFGVRQKERLKELRADVHVLTLTATPIPRTLQMALAGVRDLSLIATPPVDRLAVRTFVLPYDGVIVREAIMREHFRGGQVFYVCPRIEDLPKLFDQLATLVPEVKVGVAHGQLAPTELEDVMSAFYERRFDLLLSTNIIESGLDVPTANTLIIHRADMFGLAQLYQLRGRVGRSKQRAYAYLTVPAGQKLSDVAQRRLEVMQTLDSLGAGFTLASHDLDHRGAGNLLGEEQSGHIKEVGVELYQQMLEEAVVAQRTSGSGTETAGDSEWTPSITLGTGVMIPDSYVADLDVRMALYRRAAELADERAIEGFAAELIDRFGALPVEVENLLAIVALKQLCRKAGVAKLDAGPKGVVLSFRQDRFADPEGLVRLINTNAGSMKLRPDHRLVYQRDWADGKRRLEGVRKLMQRLAVLGAPAPAKVAV